MKGESASWTDAKTMTPSGKKKFHWWLIGVGGVLIVLDLLFFFGVLAPTRRIVTTRGMEHEKVVKALSEKRADVARLDAIQSHLSNASGREALHFQKFLWTADDGFAALIQSLGEAGKRAGVQKGRSDFKTSNSTESGLVEVQVGLPVEGTYTNIVKFINAIERADHVLIIDSIALQSGPDNPDLIRLHLSMFAYLKTG